MKRVRFLGLIVVYGIILSLLTFRFIHAFFTDSANSSENTFTAAAEFPSDVADHIVISEVQTATSGASTSDFIELYNPTSSVVSLNGHRLVKRTNGGTIDTQIKAFGASDNIPAHGFYVWASSDGGYAAQIGADTSTSENIADDNSIALRNGLVDTGIIVDAVGWGTPTGNPLTEGTALSDIPSGQSIERKASSLSDATSMTSGGDVNKGNGFDENNNATDFIVRTTPQPQNNGSTIETP